MNNGTYFPDPQLPNLQPKVLVPNNVNIKNSFDYHLRMEFLF